MGVDRNPKRREENIIGPKILKNKTLLLTSIRQYFFNYTHFAFIYYCPGLTTIEEAAVLSPVSRTCFV